MHAEGEIS